MRAESRSHDLWADPLPRLACAPAHPELDGSRLVSADLLQADRGGKVDVHVLDEGSAEGNGEGVGKDHGFWRHLPGERRFLGIKVAAGLELTQPRALACLPLPLTRA